MKDLIHSEKSQREMKWSLGHIGEIVSELSDQFEKEWNKLEILCTKGLEKTAFLGSKLGNEESKIKMISKVKDYISVCGEKLNSIFIEGMNALRSSQQNEAKLNLEIEQKNKQIEIWEKTNEEIETHLNEVDDQKLNLNNIIKELKNELQNLKKNEKNYELIISSKNEELFRKDNEIGTLLSKLQEKDKNYKQVESEKSLAEKLQKDAFINLEEFQNINKKQTQTTQNEIKSLNNLNKNLNQSLKNEVNIKKTLIQELEDLKQQLEKKDMLIQEAYNVTRLEDTAQFENLQYSYLQKSQLPRLSIHNDIDSQNYFGSKGVSGKSNSIMKTEDKGIKLII